jgi:hypothetical protein
MAKTFTAQVANWAALTKRNQEYVAKQSIQDVLEGAQTTQVGIGAGATSFVEGKIPVVSSELVNSLTVDGASGPDAYVTAIAGMDIGDFIRFAWTAPYALRIEAGFSGTDELGRTYEQPGRFFVLRNAERFSEFVENRVREVRT